MHARLQLLAERGFAQVTGDVICVHALMTDVHGSASWARKADVHGFVAEGEWHVLMHQH